MAKSNAAVPCLPTSPLSLKCPFCKAKPFKDCVTASGQFSIVHVQRIEAAAKKSADTRAERL